MFLYDSSLDIKNSFYSKYENPLIDTYKNYNKLFCLVKSKNDRVKRFLLCLIRYIKYKFL